VLQLYCTPTTTTVLNVGICVLRPHYIHTRNEEKHGGGLMSIPFTYQESKAHVPIMPRHEEYVPLEFAKVFLVKE
jgi:hypothetical protein